MKPYDPVLCDCGHSKSVHYASGQCLHGVYDERGHFTHLRCDCTKFRKAPLAY